MYIYIYISCLGGSLISTLILICLQREELLIEIQTRQEAVKAQKRALRRRKSSSRSEDLVEVQDIPDKPQNNRYFLNYYPL